MRRTILYGSTEAHFGRPSGETAARVSWRRRLRDFLCALCFREIGNAEHAALGVHADVVNFPAHTFHANTGIAGDTEIDRVLRRSPRPILAMHGACMF